MLSLAYGLSILFIFSKNQLLVFFFLIFSFLFLLYFALPYCIGFAHTLTWISHGIIATVSFISFSPHFCSEFGDFFPSTNFGVLLFLFALCVKESCLFSVSLVSWGRLVLLWTSLLALLSLNPIGLGVSCFHFHLFLCIFWFLFLFLPWSVSYSEECCLACIWLCFYSFSFL